jgi:hypothetical protein
VNFKFLKKIITQCGGDPPKMMPTQSEDQNPWDCKKIQKLTPKKILSKFPT